MVEYPRVRVDDRRNISKILEPAGDGEKDDDHPVPYDHPI